MKVYINISNDNSCYLKIICIINCRCGIVWLTCVHHWASWCILYSHGSLCAWRLQPLWKG